MGSLETIFTFDADRVIFDGDGDGAECIAIDLLNGAYFTFTPDAAVVWSFIRTGGTPAELCSGEDIDVVSSLETLTSTLLTEGLVISAPVGTQARIATSSEIKRSQEAAKGDLSFSRHTDLQDLFTIDPVHDVDATIGWPQLTDTPPSE